MPGLGSATFTLDPSRVVEGTMAAGGTPLELVLTDGVGLTWTLTIPADALAARTRVTMTALQDVRSVDLPIPLTGGVRLEPDGLDLDVPATLVVSGAGVGTGTVLLGGAHDGTAMDATMPADSGGGAAASLAHFSTYAAGEGDEATLDALWKRVAAEYTVLADRARALIKDASIEVPRPPSVPLRCVDGDAQQANEADLAAFIDRFGEPEMPLVRKMLAVQRRLALLGETVDTGLEVGLLNRLAKKVDLLVGEYGGQAENLRAIAAVGMRIAYQVALLGGDQAVVDRLGAAVAATAEKAIRELLEELRSDHEYRNLGAILETARTLHLLSSTTVLTLDEVNALLKRALAFDLVLGFELRVNGDQFYEFAATVPVDFDLTTSLSGALTGTGTVTLVSYRNTAAPDVTITAPDTPVESAVMDVDPCGGTATVTFDTLAPATETYHIDEDLDQAMPFAKGAFKAVYGAQAGGLGYQFPIKLHNRDAVAADEAIEAVAPNSKGKVEATVTVRLIHTPGR